MLNRNVDLRVEAKTIEAEAKALKLEEGRALKRARRLLAGNRMTNTDTDARTGLAYLTHRNIYVERMNVRREARLHHLTRMMLKGKDYADIEPFTYHRVDPTELYERVWQWEPSVSLDHCVIWLGQDAA